MSNANAYLEDAEYHTHTHTHQLKIYSSGPHIYTGFSSLSGVFFSLSDGLTDPGSSVLFPHGMFVCAKPSSVSNAARNQEESRPQERTLLLELIPDLPAASGLADADISRPRWSHEAGGEKRGVRRLKGTRQRLKEFKPVQACSSLEGDQRRPHEARLN